MKIPLILAFFISATALASSSNDPKDEIASIFEELRKSKHNAAVIEKCSQRLEVLRAESDNADATAVLAYAKLKAFYRSGDWTKKESYDKQGYEAAKALALQAYAKSPDRFYPTYLAARFAIHESDFPKAESLMQAALKLGPDSIVANLGIVVVLRKLKRYDAAREILRQWKGAAANKILVISEFLDIASAEQNLVEVDARHRELIEHDPNNPWAKGNYAAFLETQGRTDEAIGFYKQALAIAKYGVALRGLSHAYVDKSLEATRQGKFDEAISFGKTALESWPENPYANNNIGLTYMRKGDYVSAIPYLIASMDKDQSKCYPEQFAKIAFAYEKTGSQAKADEYYRLASRVNVVFDFTTATGTSGGSAYAKQMYIALQSLNNERWKLENALRGAKVFPSPQSANATYIQAVNSVRSIAPPPEAATLHKGIVQSVNLQQEYFSEWFDAKGKGLEFAHGLDDGTSTRIPAMGDLRSQVLLLMNSARQLNAPDLSMQNKAALGAIIRSIDPGMGRTIRKKAQTAAPAPPVVPSGATGAPPLAAPPGQAKAPASPGPATSTTSLSPIAIPDTGK